MWFTTASGMTCGMWRWGDLRLGSVGRVIIGSGDRGLVGASGVIMCGAGFLRGVLDDVMVGSVVFTLGSV
eukprot:12418862-Ditylum_brightwellii.AAC.1